MPGPRLLLVEDSQLDRELAKELLPWTPVESTTGKAAEALVVAGGFDVLLLAQHLPDGPGSDLLERLRARGFALPVIGLLGPADDDVREEFFAAGANAVVGKDGYLNGELEQMVRSLLEQAVETAPAP